MEKATGTDIAEAKQGNIKDDILYSVSDCVRITGMSRATFYYSRKIGKIDFYEVPYSGHKRFILGKNLKNFIKIKKV